MEKRDHKLKHFLEHALPWVVLVFLLFYTYAKFAQHPYSGFRLSTDGYIETFYVNNEEQSLRVGDRIIQIDSLRWEDFKADYRKTIFKGVQPGQAVQLEIERNDHLMTISWMYPGPNLLEVLDLIFSEAGIPEQDDGLNKTGHTDDECTQAETNMRRRACCHNILR